MRIVHLVSRSQRRGAERAALELAEALDELGHDNRVIALVEGMNGTRDAALPPLVGTSSLGWLARGIGAWRFARFLSHERPDVVLAHGGTAAQVAVATPSRYRPAIVWQQILPFPENILRQPRRTLWQTVTRAIDGSIALTNEGAEAVRTLGFAGPVWVIPNFRRPERFYSVDRDAAAEELRARARVPGSVMLIGAVGYLVRQKRPELALDVLTGVRREGVDAHLVIAGDGPLRSDIEHAVTERGLQSHVTLLGHRDDVERVFAGVDVAIMTSDVEGIPGVAIEAAMSGCPFVTFPVGGVREVVDDGVTGLVVERSDTNVMAAQVADLLRDEQRRKRMGIEARRRSRRFALEECVGTYATALGECSAAKARPRVNR